LLESHVATGSAEDKGVWARAQKTNIVAVLGQTTKASKKQPLKMVKEGISGEKKALDPGEEISSEKNTIHPNIPRSRAHISRAQAGFTIEGTPWERSR